MNIGVYEINHDFIKFGSDGVWVFGKIDPGCHI
jgi:hypothetical protein